MADQDDAAGPDREPGSDNIVEFTVSELSFALKRTVEDAYGYVRVRGELGRISRPGSGHIYLDLKDDKAVLAGVIWRGVAAKLKIQPEQGLEVVVTGRLTTYPGQSKYQIVIEALEPAGLGALMALLEERRKKLAAEGLFDDARKQPLPYLPRVIGVVTSPTGAVIRDILHRLADRFPVGVVVWPVRVQGETSAEEVAAAITGFNALKPGDAVARPDLIIVARGGGSVEDLWSFNEEIVVRAAAASKIPLISAVGHETDWTLIDYVADMRAPTPTGAAEMAVPVRSELIATVGDFQSRLRRSALRLYDERLAALRAALRGLPRLDQLLGLPRQRLDGAGARMPHALNLNVQRFGAQYRAASQRLGHALALNTQQNRARYQGTAVRLMPNALKARIGDLDARLGDYHVRLRRQPGLKMRDGARHVASLAKLLGSLGYQNVLKRGFVLVRGKDGKTIARARALTPGARVALEFHDGRAGAEIVSTGAGAAPKKGQPQTSPAGKTATAKDGQGKLF